MSRITGRSPAARLAASFLSLACLTVPVVACGSGDRATGTLGPGLTLSGGNARAGIVTALVGSWFHLVYLPDREGSVRTSETTLTFRSDGTLTRTVVARELSSGFADQVISTGTWRATATTVSIAIDATDVGGTGDATGGSPIDSGRTDGGFLAPLPPNPPLTPNPPFGTDLSGASPLDSLGTSDGAATFTYRIITSAEGTTLFLDEVPFVRLTSTQ